MDRMRRITSAAPDRCAPASGPRASADGRAYLASEATARWPDLAISIGVDAPASASWVSALYRSWCRVGQVLRQEQDVPGPGGHRLRGDAGPVWQALADEPFLGPATCATAPYQASRCRPVVWSPYLD
jgi:hypothetical protein